MKKLVFLFLAGFFLIGPFESSEATIIDIDEVNGVGYFKDISTGYTWMDVDNFHNWSRSEVNNAIDGTDFQMASYADVITLRTGLGYLDSDAFEFSIRLIIGDPYPDYPYSIHGWVSDLESDPNYPWPGYVFIGTGNQVGINYTNAVRWDGMGAWVVNKSSSDTVPEPTTMLLFGLGLIGALGVIRSKK